MAVKIFQFPVQISVVPLGLVGAVDASGAMYGDGPVINATIKAMNTASSVDEMYKGVNPTRFKNFITSPLATLNVGGRNGGRNGISIMVAGLHDFEKEDLVDLVPFDSYEVTAAQGGNATSTNSAGIVTMRAKVHADSQLDAAAMAKTLALPPLPTTKVTSAAWTSSTPDAVARELPLVLPTFSANNDVLTAFLMQAARDALAKWKRSYQLKVEPPAVLAPVIGDYSHYYEMISVKASGFGVEKTTVQLPLYVDDVTGAISMAPLVVTPAINEQLAYEKALAQELDAAYRGGRDAVLPALPALEPSTKNQQWEQGMKDLVGRFNAERASLSNTAYNKAVTGGFVGTIEAWLASLTAKTPTAKTPLGENSTWWKTALDAISAGGSKVWDTVNDWGPTGLVTAYGGVTAVNEVKKNSWLLPIAIIGGAAVLLRK